MRHGNFNPIFNAYGLDPGVIGSIDMYNGTEDIKEKVIWQNKKQR
jgi:hypothetical protein